MPKSLSELYNFKKSSKKISSKDLKKIILEEYQSVLKEQEETASTAGSVGSPPRGDAVNKTTNVKDVDPVEIVNQLLSGDDNSPIAQSTQGKWFAFDGAAGKAWVEKIGPEVVVDRIKVLADKIPSTGLPKKDMPFLPGPPDAAGTVDQVVDALSPGGEFNIDSHAEDSEAEEEKVMEAMVLGFKYLLEQTPPPAPNTFVGMSDKKAQDFMTAGHQDKDGDASDDDIKIVAGGSVPASSAIPTQSNILIYKSLGMAVQGLAGGDLDAWAGTGGEILDGHHRWAATMLNDPSAKLGTAGQVDLNALGNPKQMLKYLTAIGNALGNATKTESRKNSEDAVIMERWNKLAGVLKN